MSDSAEQTEQQEELNQVVHDLRGNLHAIEMAVHLLENEAASDRQRQLVGALQAELIQGKQNLELLVAAARS